MLWSTFAMALRELRRNTMRSVLTTLGIIIGVGAVIALVTLGRGATVKVTSEIAAMGKNLLIVMPGAERRGPISAGARGFKREDGRAIEREVAAVGEIAPSVGSSALVVAGNKNWSTQVNGSTNAFFSVRGYALATGRTFSDAELLGGTPVCVLGATVQRELFAAQDPLDTAIRVGSVSCKVIGVLASKGTSSFGPDQDDFVVMPLSLVQRRFTGSTDVGSFFVSAVSDQEVDHAKQQITALLRERRRIATGQPDDFTVEDTKQIANALSSVTTALTALLGAIAAVSLLVGGIGIMNIMLVSVTERTREIGLRMAIGALADEVLLQFLVEAVALSTLGGLLGIAFGVGLSAIASRAFTLPLVLQPDILLVAVGFSGAIGVAFGYVPARKAARLRPIEALRHE
ncbi:Macrolide export ATP-binding/permease protein MacB [Minicystis rosea]|nr:Macrolide export ATP-binding/permease protein MacB [Minicystis rosea]